MYSLSHLSDRDLLRGLTALVSRDRSNTALLLAHIAEVDARKLYLPAAYSSMFEYCVRELGLSEDAAYRRIRSARAARQFPVIFEALASGKVHLAGVCVLAPYLNAGNVNALLDAAGFKKKAEIEEMIAERYPRSEMLALIESLPARADQGASVNDSTCQLVPGRVGTLETSMDVVAPDSIPVNLPTASAPTITERSVAPAPSARASVAPIACERFALHFTMGRSTREKLQHVKDLLAHQIPSGDLAAVIDRALDLAILQLEKRKMASVERPRRVPQVRSNTRHIPADVKREVWRRDEGHCTYVSEEGRRCGARSMLEYDHVEEFCRGGAASAENIRLRCRAHNQYAAERSFGIEFMRRKREEARLAAKAQT